MRNISLFMWMLIVVGCAHRSAATREAPAEGASGAGGLGAGAGGETAAPGPVAGRAGSVAPPIATCAVDNDCAVGATLDASGCCWDFGTYATTPQSAAYAAWAKATKDACAVARCPSPPVPRPLANCSYIARCAEGTCVSSCPR